MTTITKAFTHAGIFHADDVFAAALLRILFPGIVIERVFKVPELGKTEIAFDIGGGEFDHHDAKAPKRVRPDTGTPLSSFGLLWAKFGHELVDDDGWTMIDKSLVAPIDITDNSGTRNALSSAIATFNPCWDEDDRSADEAFEDAVSLALRILKRSIHSANSNSNARSAVAEAMKTAADGVMVLDRFVPWQSHVPTDSGVRMVIFPSLRGGWSIQTVNSEKFPLPASWLDTPPDGLTFCHPARFLAAANDKDTALKHALVAAAPFI